MIELKGQYCKDIKVKNISNIHSTFYTNVIFILKERYEIAWLLDIQKM